MKSKFKNAISVDYSGNNIYNISRIIGNEYTKDKLTFNDTDIDKFTRLSNLLITTAGDNEGLNKNIPLENQRAAGNLLLTAGVATRGSGYVHLYSGVATEPKNPINRGILLQPDSNIYITSNEANVRIGALKDSVFVGQERLILSNDQLLETNPQKNYISFIKSFKDASTHGTTLARNGEAIISYTPNLEINYGKTFWIHDSGIDTTFDLDVDKLDVETSYKISSDNVLNVPAFKLSITGNNTSSVSIKDITSYGLITALNLQQTGDFTFKNTFKSDGKGTPNDSTNYDRIFQAFGKNLFEEFRNINIRTLGTSINNTTGVVTGDIFALLANKDVEGSSNYSKLFIQNIEASKDVQIWGNITFGKDNARKKIEVYSSDLDIASNDTLETHKIYKVNAGNIRSDGAYPYILDVNTTSNLTIDNIDVRTHLHSKNTFEVDEVSTLHNDLILNNPSNKNTIKTKGTSESLNIDSPTILINQRSETLRKIEIDDTNKLKLTSDDLNIETSNVKINNSSSLGLNSNTFNIYRSSTPTGDETSNFQLNVSSASESFIRIQDVKSTRRLDAVETYITGNLTFNNPEKPKAINLKGSTYNQEFNLIDIKPTNDLNLARLLAYSSTSQTKPILPSNWPSALYPKSNESYSLILSKNLKVDDNAFIQGNIDIHKIGVTIEETDKFETYTKLFNLWGNKTNLYSTDLNIISGFKKVPSTSKEISTEFSGLIEKASPATFKLKVTTAESTLNLNKASFNTLSVNNTSYSNALDITGDSNIKGNINFTGANRRITNDAYNLTIEAKTFNLKSKSDPSSISILDFTNDRNLKVTPTTFTIEKYEATNKSIDSNNNYVKITTGTENSYLEVYQAKLNNLSLASETIGTSNITNGNIENLDVTKSLDIGASDSSFIPVNLYSSNFNSKINTSANININDKLFINTGETYTLKVDTAHVYNELRIKDSTGNTGNTAKLISDGKVTFNNTLYFGSSTGGLITTSSSNTNKALTFKVNKLSILSQEASADNFINIEESTLNNRKIEVLLKEGSFKLERTKGSNNYLLLTTKESESNNNSYLNIYKSNFVTSNANTLTTNNITVRSDSPSVTFKGNTTFNVESGSKINYTSPNTFKIADVVDFSLTGSDTSGNKKLEITNNKNNANSYIEVYNIRNNNLIDTDTLKVNNKTTLNGDIEVASSKKIYSNGNLSIRSNNLTIHDSDSAEKSSIKLLTTSLSLKGPILSIIGGTDPTQTPATTGFKLYGSSTESYLTVYDIYANELHDIKIAEITTGTIHSINVDTAFNQTKGTFNSTGISSYNVSTTGLLSLTSATSSINLGSENNKLIASVTKDNSTITSNNFVARTKVEITGTAADTDALYVKTGRTHLQKLYLDVPASFANSIEFNDTLNSKPSVISSKHIIHRTSKFAVGDNNTVANKGNLQIDTANSSINLNATSLDFKFGSSNKKITLETSKGSNGDHSYLYAYESRHNTSTIDNLNVEQKFEVHGNKGFNIYWDETNNSLVFAKGNMV